MYKYWYMPKNILHCIKKNFLKKSQAGKIIIQVQGNRDN